jgi:hypothetical protein
LVADDSLTGKAIRDIHGLALKMRVAWLSSGNRVGFEIFEYFEPKAQIRPENLEYWKSGFTHICITGPNIDGSIIKFQVVGENSGVMCGKLFQIKDTR